MGMWVRSQIKVGGDYDIFPLEHRVEGAIPIVVNIYVELMN